MRMRRGVVPSESGRSRPSLVVISGTETTNSIRLALICATMLLPRRASGSRISALAPCCIELSLYLFGADVGVLDNRGPFAVLGCEERREFLWRTRVGLNAELRELGLKLRRRHAFIVAIVAPQS